MLFKSKPNLPLGEKAKVEFHMQQLAECIGNDRLKLPVLSYNALLDIGRSQQSPEQKARIIVEHLFHDVTELNVQVIPEAVEKCGGGG